MKRSLIKIACATAIGVLALSAQAQTPQYKSAAPSTPDSDIRAQADEAYAAAKTTCEGQMGTAKITCLKNAKADYERWLRTGEVDAAAVPGASTTGAKGGGAVQPGGMPTAQKK